MIEGKSILDQFFSVSCRRGASDIGIFVHVRIEFLKHLLQLKNRISKIGNIIGETDILVFVDCDHFQSRRSRIDTDIQRAFIFFQRIRRNNILIVAGHKSIIFFLRCKKRRKIGEVLIVSILRYFIHDR